MKSYETARKIGSFLEFIGWIIVIMGIIAGLAMANNAGPYVSTDRKILTFVSGLSISLVGIICIGLVQHWRASVDTAELTQQILKVARDQLEVSRQLLAGHSGVSTSFADAAAKTEEESRASFADIGNASEGQQGAPAIEAAHSDSAPTAEDLQPKKMIDYNGAEISQTAAGFLAHDVMFETLDGAKEFVDDRIKVNRRLPGAFKV